MGWLWNSYQTCNICNIWDASSRMYGRQRWFTSTRKQRYCLFVKPPTSWKSFQISFTLPNSVGTDKLQQKVTWRKSEILRASKQNRNKLATCIGFNYFTLPTVKFTYLVNMWKTFLFHWFVTFLCPLFVSRLRVGFILVIFVIVVIGVNRVQSLRIYVTFETVDGWRRRFKRCFGGIRATRLVVFAQLDHSSPRLILMDIRGWRRYWGFFWYCGTKICWHNKKNKKLLTDYLRGENCNATLSRRYRLRRKIMPLSWVILLTVCCTILMTLLQRIWYWINYTDLIR